MEPEILSPEPQIVPTTPKKDSGLFHYLFIFIMVIALGVLLVIAYFSKAPNTFKQDTLVTVYSGMTTKDLGTLLENQGVIRSGKWFRLILSMRWKNQSIRVGDYIFEKPQPVFTIAYRVTHGIYGNSRIKITFPEGISVRAMGEILLKNIPDFSISDFLSKAQSREGYLFPDTYYFFRTMSVDQIIEIITTQFDNKLKSLGDVFQEGVTKNSIYGKKRSIKDIVTMASILEREANNGDEAKTISGILWKRIQKNMPLQVDATFLYTINKGSDNLTITDLYKDSPYNTYTRTGLPIGPIGNPGEVMIRAALEPVDSPYWYYLHDNQGNIHYAKTYQEHLKNKQKYLK